MPIAGPTAPRRCERSSSIRAVVLLLVQAPLAAGVTAAQRIREGTSVVVFPEGTRSPDGSVRRFKRGSFRLALEAGVPVVPVSLAGVKAVVPHGFGSLVPGSVGVRVHAAVPVAGRGPEEAEALAEEVRQIVAAGCTGGKGEPS